MTSPAHPDHRAYADARRLAGRCTDGAAASPLSSTAPITPFPGGSSGWRARRSVLMGALNVAMKAQDASLTHADMTALYRQARRILDDADTLRTAISQMAARWDHFRFAEDKMRAEGKQLADAIRRAGWPVREFRADIDG